MNKLTDRLQLIADQINKGETMADIGTDHGFLPLYLYEEGICPKVIMCDISEPSLSKAKENFAERIPEESGNYIHRVGDGLQVIEKNEVDTVVIAGMGGLLIKEILEADIDKSKSFSKFILQPRNNSGLLRHWLVSHGFRITHNLLVREGKFICEIIVVGTTKNVDFFLYGFGDFVTSTEEAQWDFPHEFLERYPDLGKEYAITRLEIEEKKKAGILKGCNVNESDLLAVEKRIEYYKNILFK